MLLNRVTNNLFFLTHDKYFLNSENCCSDLSLREVFSFVKISNVKLEV